MLCQFQKKLKIKFRAAKNKNNHNKSMSKIFLSALLFLFISANTVAVTKPAKVANWVDTTLNNMSLDEKIGQLFMIAAYSNRTPHYEEEIEKAVREYHIGGLIFFQGQPARQVELTNRYQKASKYPLMIGMDAEHGIGWRLQSAMEFPKMLINGAVTNDSLIYQLGAKIARHCKELGVHVNFSPVVDINNNQLNPVIGMRSFGEDPEAVTRKAILYIQGSLSEQVLPVAKHFPGHGDTDTDSHMSLPVIPHSYERLDSIELYPYKKLIEARVPAVMIAHLNVKSLDSTDTPASLSSAIVNDFLKGKLRYEGLCITDAMNMKGVTQGLKPGEAEVKALLAGNDILLFPANLEKAVGQIKQAIADNILTEEMITQKCRKILLAKNRFVLPTVFPSQTLGLWGRINTPEDLALKQNLYKNAVTLIKNTGDLLPLKRLDTLKIASLNYGAKSLNNFQTMLAKYAPVRSISAEEKLNDNELAELGRQLHPYNCVIIYNNCSQNNPAKKFGYSESLAKLIRQLKGKRLIICHPATPYGLKEYVNLPIDAFLISYDKDIYAQQYAAQAIFGGIAVTGKLPVSINPDYREGISLQTPKTRLGYSTPEMCGIASAKLAEIDTLCERAVRTEATPGCQVLVAKNGQIIYNKAFGYNTYKKQKPNNTDNIYDLASVTKITATLPAVMKLYDEKKIELDRPLSEYFTTLKTTNKKDITVREVLCHNAGLKTFIPFMTDAVDKKSLPGPLFTTTATKYNTAKLKDKLYANLNYQFKDSTISNNPKPGYTLAAPGLYLFQGYQDSIVGSILKSGLNKKKEYAYSDVGFMLLKYAVEQVTHRRMDQFCRDTFYRKLGASNTDFCGNERLNTKNIVPSSIDKLYRKTEIKGSVHDPGAALLGGVAGHAGLFSTAEDLAKIMELYLKGGSYGGETYFSPETIKTFTRKNTAFPSNRRGLGFDKPETDTTKAGPTCRMAPASSFGHMGFTGTIAWCDPENELIYIFLSNRTYPDEFNTKLTEEGTRTRIQEVIYKAIKKTKEKQVPITEKIL